jgi:hypothetical protein
MTDITTYPDNGAAESTVFLGTTGDPPVLLSREASVQISGGNKIDGQTSGGSNKARVKFKGLELSRLIISFVLLPEDEEQFWSDTYTLLRMPGEKGRALPLDITNGMANRAGITTIVIDDYEIDEADPVHGRSVVIRAREWSSEVFEPKAEPQKGKARIRPPTGPFVNAFDTTLDGTVTPKT